MATLDDLISQVPDLKLRQRLQSAATDLRRKQKFGLVFEEHLPETTTIYGLPVLVGALVQLRKKPTDNTQFRVTEIDAAGKSAVLRSPKDEELTVPLADLLVVKRFGEPMYASLKPLHQVRRGDGQKPYHAVINGENFHTLQLFTYIYQNAVDCIYIDPPYNTGATHWKYNNKIVDTNDGWRHSKFLAFLERRLRLARRLLRTDGVLIITIDKNELYHVGMLLEKVMPDYEMHAVSIVINPKGTNEDNFARTNEFALFCVPPKKRIGRELIAGRLSAIEDDKPLQSTLEFDEAFEPDETPESQDEEFEYWGLIRGGQESSKREARPNQFFPMYLDSATGTILEVGKSLPKAQTKYPTGKDAKGRQIVWPMGKDGEIERVWRYEPERMKQEIKSDLVRVTPSKNGTWTFSLKRPKKARKRTRTVWWDSLHDAGLNGSSLLERFVPHSGFPFPKSLYAVRDCLDLVCGDRPDALIVDFFAGSGTTLHSTLLMNALDGGNRRCVLVTNNELDPKTERSMRTAGHFRGDQEYESQGIFYHATVPRIEAAVTGKRADGSPVPGRYKDRITRKDSKLSYSDGFPENVEFYDLQYLDPDDVQLGEQLRAINVLLWAAAGGKGERKDPDEDAPFYIPADSPYGLLLKTSRLAKFVQAIEERPDITHVWVVTDSDEAFAEACSALPSHVTYKSQLYRDYLRTFRVNGGRHR